MNTLKKIVYCIYILLFFSITNSYSVNYEDKAIQATATLLFHLNQKIEASASAITFENQEVENLWSAATPLDSSITLLQENYWAAHQLASEDDKLLLKDCADQLRSIWLKANFLDHHTQEVSFKSNHYALDNVVGNPLATPKINKEISRYLLPSDSPYTPLMDQLFSSSRATYNSSTLQQAGFKILHEQPRSFITVASHPALPGVLIKLYYDTELRRKYGDPGWKWFARRCSGAEIIRNVIAKKHIKYFTVPFKYIYVLPPQTIPLKSPTVDPKLAVLVVQDMQLVDEELNYAAWKVLITPEILNELYIIISRANGSSYRPDNIPFTKSGQFAFIDTEYPYQNPDFESIRKYLSTPMRDYWDSLVKRGGP